MPKFNDIQSNLTSTKKTLQQSKQQLLLAKEKLKKLEHEKENVLRRSGSESDLVAEINQNLEAQKRTIASNQSLVNEHLQLHADVFANFQPFTDPREHISKLSDNFPILLFPVRIETRFKRLRDDNEIQHQLWVRIFPDECSVDTFEEILSEDEIVQAQIYWAALWSAGQSDDEALQSFIQDRQKAAWRGLAGNIQPGRAYYIIQNYVPENIGNLPERTSDDEVILVISTEELPSQTEQNALKDYWAVVWATNNEADEVNNAFTLLVNAVNDETRANELITQYVPNNLQSVPPATEDNSQNVQVVFVDFPKLQNTDSTQASWSQAAKVTTLPERFVLLGYKKDAEGNPQLILNEIGNAIPDPLIVGPDPSLEINEVLINALGDELSDLSEAELETKLSEIYDRLKPEIQAGQTSDEFVANSKAALADDFDTTVVEIFTNQKDDLKAEQYIHYLTKQSETSWLFDFEEAVKNGMGFKLNINGAQFADGFDRLFVVGIKLGADQNEAKKELEDLFRHHHFGTTGFSIIPQGTATNNTEDEKSGYSESEEPEDSFERYILQTEENDPDDFFRKKDGKWLAEILGISAENASLKLAANYYYTDQCEAKAMNTALWNTTLGYYMESMMTPVFTEWQHTVTRRFFRRFVSGRGGVPAIQIGEQPYGILAVTTYRQQEWLFDRGSNFLNDFPLGAFSDMLPVFRDIYRVALRIYEDFNSFLGDVAYVGKEGDPHQILLQALGLHATSAEYHQRYAESLSDLINRLKLNGSFVEQLMGFLLAAAYQQRSDQQLQKLGYDPGDEPETVPLLEKFFLQNQNLLKGPIIDDRPLSEKDPIRAYTEPDSPDATGENYIYWLIENARSNFNNLKTQKGFAEDMPKALLYDMLRHSMNLAYSNTSYQAYLNANLLNNNQIRTAKIDPDFVGVQTQVGSFIGRFDLLEHKDERISDLNLSVADHITSLVANNVNTPLTAELRQMINALEHLKDVPTARLERLLAEHIDCCTYRLDAWLQGFVNMQLYGMRNRSFSVPEATTTETGQQQGIYIGAFGWVEELRPDPEVLSPIDFEDELQNIFNPEGNLEIITDSNNAGYIHAPSVSQAATAAVLRNAYISEASPEDPEIYKVNLSSERVRMAMSIIQGMQQGQSLSALLGYQFERGLHDRHSEAEVDKFIYELRAKFPLGANRLSATAEEIEGDNTIRQYEARNVIDGLALLQHIEDTGNNEYPFGLDGLSNATNTQADVINSEVKRLFNINDAVADVATAEGIHHVIQANYERAAATLDTYSKGNFPQVPEVVRTPRSGIALTNRIGIHLQPGLSSPASAHPRIKAEPAVNKFLEDILPPLNDIACKVAQKIPAYNEQIENTEEEIVVTMAELGLSQADLLYILNVDSDKSLTALDDYILKWIYKDLPDNDATVDEPRPDVVIEIKYTEAIDGKITVFELAPLVRSLRELILSSRPLKSIDIVLPNEANTSDETTSTIDVTRINETFETLKSHFTGNDPTAGLDIINDAFAALIVEDDFEATLANQQQIVDGIDGYIQTYVNTLKELSLFGIPEAAFGFIYQRISAIYSAYYQKVIDYKARWDGKAEEYNTLMNTDLPAAATDEEKIVILQKAERLISTNYTNPLPDPPNTVDDYTTIVDNKKADFDAKLGELQAFLDGVFVDVADLVAEVDKIITGVGSATGDPLSDFDLDILNTEEDERQIVVCAEDMLIKARKLNEILVKKAEKVQELLDAHAAEANADKKLRLLTQAAKLLLGEDFVIVPEFSMNNISGDELKQSFDDRQQLLNYQINEANSDFPVDDWLYGIARVRDKMWHWENMIMLAEGFGKDEIKLAALQLPYRINDSWLALAHPEDYEIDHDKLLYTAYLQSFDPNQPQCGLLVDEWTETVPTDKETTGLTFQYDQPNAEPPQTMLLVTPQQFTGEWQWQNVVDTLHQTLDLAKLRAIEPENYADSAYAHLLPATISAVTRFAFINMTLNYSANNGVAVRTNPNDDA